MVKIYVEPGPGVGMRPIRRVTLKKVDRVKIDTHHLFDANTVWLGLKRGQLQRNYGWQFLERCNAKLSLEEIKRQVLSEETENDRLSTSRFNVYSGRYSWRPFPAQHKISFPIAKQTPTQISFDAAPFGGTKLSGLGREGSR
ncbi:hypothetical protein K5Y32_15220 [Pantoea sp. DY-15]|uniref:hypothetical protein n=1 Tax=Pantoea sp. DY-15 TaxID=2871489 RepID=UPI001C97A557|nr:hypothetical protein [Pantoea sp. DY-15]MBY4889292.1 hypothetical protein [Pantoea sp. DY-15]